VIVRVAGREDIPEMHRSRANIWALFVDPGLEGRGAGRALHDAMIDWIFGEGLERVWLGTEPGTRAERFYRSAGWRYIGNESGDARYELTASEWTSLAGHSRRAKLTP